MVNEDGRIEDTLDVWDRQVAANRRKAGLWASMKVRKFVERGLLDASELPVQRITVFDDDILPPLGGLDSRVVAECRGTCFSHRSALARAVPKWSKTSPKR